MKSQFLAVFTRTPFPNALKLHLQESFGNRTIEFWLKLNGLSEARNEIKKITRNKLSLLGLLAASRIGIDTQTQ